MATIEVSTTTYEPCGAFVAESAAGADPECATCGWLEQEHDPLGDDAALSA